MKHQQKYTQYIVRPKTMYEIIEVNAHKREIKKTVAIVATEQEADARARELTRLAVQEKGSTHEIPTRDTGSDGAKRRGRRT